MSVEHNAREIDCKYKVIFPQTDKLSQLFVPI